MAYWILTSSARCIGSMTYLSFEWMYLVFWRIYIYDRFNVYIAMVQCGHFCIYALISLFTQRNKSWCQVSSFDLMQFVRTVRCVITGKNASTNRDLSSEHVWTCNLLSCMRYAAGSQVLYEYRALATLSSLSITDCLTCFKQMQTSGGSLIAETTFQVIMLLVCEAFWKEASDVWVGYMQRYQPLLWITLLHIVYLLKLYLLLPALSLPLLLSRELALMISAFLQLLW